MPIPYLHSTTLALVAAVRNKTFSSSAQLQTNNRVSNGAGGFADNWQTVATLNVKLCRPRRLQGLEQAANSVQGASRWEVQCPVSQPISPQQRFAIGGKLYYVLGTNGAISDGLLQLVQCELRV